MVTQENLNLGLNLKKSAHVRVKVLSEFKDDQKTNLNEHLFKVPKFSIETLLEEIIVIKTYEFEHRDKSIQLTFFGKVGPEKLYGKV